MLLLLPDLEARLSRARRPSRAATALEHGDLHGANVLVGRGGRWFFDWADASVSHPFFTLLVTCNMVIDDLDSEAGRRASARLRDAYLEPWAAVAPASALRPLFSRSRCGWLMSGAPSIGSTCSHGAPRTRGAPSGALTSPRGCGASSLAAHVVGPPAGIASTHHSFARLRAVGSADLYWLACARRLAARAFGACTLRVGITGYARIPITAGSADPAP